MPRMRIIAGTVRGTDRRADGLDTRPTSDRVRENVFNLVGPVDDAAVLDLFAGSGAMGIEALSRGAERASSSRRDPDAVRDDRREPRRSCGLTGARSCAATPSGRSPHEARRGRKYDLVLVDPPYDIYTDLSRCSRATSRASSPTDGLARRRDRRARRAASSPLTQRTDPQLRRRRALPSSRR